MKKLVYLICLTVCLLFVIKTYDSIIRQTKKNNQKKLFPIVQNNNKSIGILTQGQAFFTTVDFGYAQYVYKYSIDDIPGDGSGVYGSFITQVQWSTLKQVDLIGSISTLTGLVGGTGYVNPDPAVTTYKNVSLIPVNISNTNGSGALATVTISTGVVTDIYLTEGGINYVIGDILQPYLIYIDISGDQVLITGSGSTITVASIESIVVANPHVNDATWSPETTVSYIGPSAPFKGEEFKNINSGNVNATYMNTVGNGYTPYSPYKCETLLDPILMWYCTMDEMQSIRDESYRNFLRFNSMLCVAGGQPASSASSKFSRSLI